MGEKYEIRIKGQLDPCWFDWFEGLAVTNLENGEALLEGDLPDQPALHAVLERIRDLNLPLIEVRKNENLNRNR